MFQVTVAYWKINSLFLQVSRILFANENFSLEVDTPPNFFWQVLFLEELFLSKYGFFFLEHFRIFKYNTILRNNQSHENVFKFLANRSWTTIIRSSKSTDWLPSNKGSDISQFWTTIDFLEMFSYPKNFSFSKICKIIKNNE